MFFFQTVSNFFSRIDNRKTKDFSFQFLNISVNFNDSFPLRPNIPRPRALKSFSILCHAFAISFFPLLFPSQVYIPWISMGLNFTDTEMPRILPSIYVLLLGKWVDKKGLHSKFSEEVFVP